MNRSPKFIVLFLTLLTIDYLMTGSWMEITVDSVTFTDGTTEYTNATSSFYL